MYPDSKPASDGMPRRCDKSEGLICKHQVGSCRVHLRTEDGISGLINAGDHTNLVHAAEEVGSSMLVIARLALGAPTVYSDGTVTRVRRPTQPWQVAKGIWAEEPARPSHTSKRKGPGAAYQIGVASRPRPSNGVVVSESRMSQMATVNQGGKNNPQPEHRR